MNLKSVLSGIEGLKAKGNLEIDVKGLESNSKEVKEKVISIIKEKLYA